MPRTCSVILVPTDGPTYCMAYPVASFASILNLNPIDPHFEFDVQGRADYFGTIVNRAARMMAGAQGGQVLMSLDGATKVCVRARARVCVCGWVGVHVIV